MVGGIAYEHTHRVIAAGLGVLIILLAGLLWRRQERTWLKWLGFAALGGVILQGILGGLTVLQLLHYWLPVMHACTAQLEFAILVSVAVFTSRWWNESLKLYEDRGSPSIRAIAVINASLVFAQVLVGAGFRHRYMSLKPHVVGAFVVIASVTVTAAVLRRRFSSVPELTRARKVLHSIVGLQFLLGLLALWSRISTADAPQPMPFMVASTVAHTVTGAILFAASIALVLVCYRLVPQGREVASTVSDRVPVQ
jgi:cytochrome c oxidase assembly protein subunit 15